MNFILQFIPGENSSHEVSTIRKYILLNGGEYMNSTISNLWSYEEQLDDGWVPVGSVEFVRKAFAILGIKEPEFSPYPEAIRQYVLREINVTDFSLGTAFSMKSNPMFVKPVKLKQFNGFVLDATKPLLDFVQEYRFYVSENKIIGYGRYDEFNTPDLPVDMYWVNIFMDALKAAKIDHPYTIDIGILSDGATDLVELNDAWAIGLYGNSLTETEYAKFLCDRWKTIYKPSY